MLSIVVIVFFAAGIAAGDTRTGNRIASAAQRFLTFYSGVFALVALTMAVAAGLVATDRIIMLPGHRIVAQAAHRAIAFIAVAFLVTHIAMEVVVGKSDAIDSLVPFLASGKTFYVGLGTIASDLMILIVATGIARRSFAEKSSPFVWRILHGSAYLAWPLAIVHSLVAGRHPKPYVSWSYGACLLAVGLALVLRSVATIRPRQATVQNWPDEAGWPTPAAASVAAQAYLLQSQRTTVMTGTSAAQPAGLAMGAAVMQAGSDVQAVQWPEADASPWPGMPGAGVPVLPGTVAHTPAGGIPVTSPFASATDGPDHVPTPANGMPAASGGQYGTPAHGMSAVPGMRYDTPAAGMPAAPCTQAAPGTQYDAPVDVTYAAPVAQYGLPADGMNESPATQYPTPAHGMPAAPGMGYPTPAQGMSAAPAVPPPPARGMPAAPGLGYPTPAEGMPAVPGIPPEERYHSPAHGMSAAPGVQHHTPAAGIPRASAEPSHSPGWNHPAPTMPTMPTMPGMQQSHPPAQGMPHAQYGPTAHEVPGVPYQTPAQGMPGVPGVQQRTPMYDMPSGPPDLPYRDPAHEVAAARYQTPAQGIPGTAGAQYHGPAGNMPGAPGTHSAGQVDGPPALAGTHHESPAHGTSPRGIPVHGVPSDGMPEIQYPSAAREYAVPPDGQYQYPGGVPGVPPFRYTRPDDMAATSAASAPIPGVDPVPGTRYPHQGDQTQAAAAIKYHAPVGDFQAGQRTQQFAPGTQRYDPGAPAPVTAAPGNQPPPEYAAVPYQVQALHPAPVDEHAGWTGT